jgi:SHS2 domain-containing protein
MPEWQHFAHGADIGVRGRADTLSGVFEQAGLGLTAVITDPALVRADCAVAVRCDAPDPELLLVEWLNTLVYEMATRRMLFSRFELSVSGASLEGRMLGESVDVARHQPAVEVKGATMTELAVRREADGQWVAQCVLDV